MHGTFVFDTVSPISSEGRLTIYSFIRWWGEVLDGSRISHDRVKSRRIDLARNSTTTVPVPTRRRVTTVHDYDLVDQILFDDPRRPSRYIYTLCHAGAAWTARISPDASVRRTPFFRRWFRFARYVRPFRRSYRRESRRRSDVRRSREWARSTNPSTITHQAVRTNLTVSRRYRANVSLFSVLNIYE